MNVSLVVPTDRNSMPVARVTRASAWRRSGRTSDDAPAVLTAYVIGSHGFHRTGEPPTRSRNRKAPSTFGRTDGLVLGEGVMVEVDGAAG